MYIVTGGAGFIGSNIIQGLNAIGENDIVVVDNLKRSEKFSNLVGCKFSDYLDKGEFLNILEKEKFSYPKIKAIFHQGACSDTMEADGQYMMDNNYAYSRTFLNWAIERKIPFIYASSAAVYGGVQTFKEQYENEQPINIYGYSKYLFDQYVRGILGKVDSMVVGLRYFNVYGPYESHKGPMASVAFQFFNQLNSTNKIKLFEGTDGYGDGEQSRDFIHVSDVVNVNLFFLENLALKGIFNVGTGKRASFNELADCLIKLEGSGEKDYIPFPDSLLGKYQSFTEADITKLQKAGYTSRFLSVQEGLERYHEILKQG
jgi:ADP-L-glycero-D-manno-heptose 6-epimerase